jgi:hypothetical protein
MIHSRLPSALGLNAAISGATVLASRLDSNTSVFSFLLFSVVWFGLFPLARVRWVPISLSDGPTRERGTVN